MQETGVYQVALADIVGLEVVADGLVVWVSGLPTYKVAVAAAEYLYIMVSLLAWDRVPDPVLPLG